MAKNGFLEEQQKEQEQASRKRDKDMAAATQPFSILFCPGAAAAE